jgi:hypothetical protein
MFAVRTQVGIETVGMGFAEMIAVYQQLIKTALSNSLVIIRSYTFFTRRASNEPITGSQTVCVPTSFIY